MTKDVHSTGKQTLACNAGITVELCCGQHTLKFSAQLMPFIGRTLSDRGFPPGVYTVTLRRKVQKVADGELFLLRGYDSHTHTGFVKLKPPGERVAWNGHILFSLPESPQREHMLRCIAQLIVDSTKGG